jgi:hypothetical protein
MAIRSRLPWPLRWAGIALVLGCGAAIGLWAFHFGQDIAGFDRGAMDELQQLRAELVQVRRDRDQARAASDVSGSTITAERAERQRLTARVSALEAENRTMRDDLAFFDHLLPASDGAGVAIRAFQAQVLDGGELKWQLLLMQPGKNAPEFHGRLVLSLTGTLAGQPWTMEMPGGAQPLTFRQYRRAEGAIALPLQAVVKNVTAKVMDGSAIRAVQSVKL